MRYSILLLLLFIPLSVSAQNAVDPQADTSVQSTLIKDIRLDGFVLQDKNQFVKMFKPYRNKYLSTDDMDTILHKIQDVYEKEGYKELVSITYQVTKHRLVFTALMTS